MKSFTIDINVCQSFTIDEIWPDGDAPENPMVDDVKAVFFKHRNVSQTCEDWGLGITRDDVTITANDDAELLRRLKEAKERVGSG